MLSSSSSSSREKISLSLSLSRATWQIDKSKISTHRLIPRLHAPLSSQLQVLSSRSAFTLVELMITIAIIGVLSASLFPMISGYMYKAKKTAMMADTKQITTALQVVMAEQGKALKDITGYTCSACYCWISGSFDGNVRTVSAGNICYDKTTQMWQTLKDMTGFWWKVPFRDPWGGMYMMDENFNENPSNPCRNDLLYSAWPSNIRYVVWYLDNNKPNQILEIGTGGNLEVNLEFPTTCP